MGGARSEVHDGTTRVLMEVATWDGPNIHRTSQVARPAQRGQRALREGPRARAGDGGPGRRHAADARADRRARSCPGTIDVGGARARPPRSIRLRDAPRRGAPRACRSRARARPRSCARSASASQEAPGRPRRHRPAFRRNDVTREADLIEEVARIDGLDKLPGDAAQAPRRAGRLTPSSACAAAPRTRSSAAACTRSSAGASPSPALADRLRLAADDPRRRFVALENPMSEDQSVCARRCSARCSTPRATTPRAARPDLALFESGAVYRDDGARQLPHEHHALGGAPRRPPAPADAGATAEPPRAGFFAAKGLLDAALDALRVRWDVEPATEPFLHPGPQRARRWPAARTSAGSASCTRSSRARGTSTDGAALFEIDLDRVRRARRRGAALPRPHDLPGAAPGPRGRRRPTTSPAATVLASRRARPAASCSPTRASSTSTAASRWGRGACRWRSRSRSARPTAR